MALFFTSAGLHLTLSFTELPAWTIAALVAVPLAGKFTGAALGALLARLDLPLTIAAGLMAKGVAEIAILLVLLEHGIIGQAVFSLFVLIMLAYMLFAPPIIGAAVGRAKPSGQGVPLEVLPPSLVRFALDDITVGEVIDREHACPDARLSKVVRHTTPKAWAEEPVEDVLARMTENSITVIPVMDRESQAFVGAITSQEIVELITTEARGGR